MSVRGVERRKLTAHTAPLADVYTSVAVSDEHSQLASSIATALQATGCDVRLTNNPMASTQELVLTTALCDGAASDIHWRVLEQAQAFRRAGGKSLVLLQDTGGSFHQGPSQGWLGGVAALARTAAIEWPDMRVRCIDIAVDATDMAGTAQRLLSALGSMLTVVGVDLTGQLYSLQAGELLPQPSQTDKPCVSNEVWLVSGGARGVTAACIEALAQRSSGKFALLGRSIPAPWPVNIEKTDDIKELRRRLAASVLAAGERPVPKNIERTARQALAGQDIRQTLATLEAAGISARYYPCDIANAQQVADVVSRIDLELGAVTSMVHGAGVLDDSALIDKTKSQFNQVFDTKVGGLQHLLGALGDRPLSKVAFFSSAAAFYGNAGQADYAMANEVLNRVAQSLQRRWPAATVKSFNWGPWESGMVDHSLARYFKERGIDLIPVQQGASIFADEMLAGHRHGVELLVGEPWAG